MKNLFLVALTLLVFIAFIAPVPCLGQDIREYMANKATKAPVIDGNVTDAEWAGSEWTGGFYGLDNDAVTKYRAQQIPADAFNWQWRMLWDEDYLYFCIQADFRYLTQNGWLFSGDVAELLSADDTGYAGWGIPGCVDFECFLEPNWKDGDGVNDPADPSPGYQLCFFPLADEVYNGKVVNPGNFGVRGAEGPPFVYTGATNQGSKFPAGDWAPISDPVAAAAAGAKPLLVAALPHEIAGAQEGSVVAQPVLEIAFPFSQFTLVGFPIVAIEDVPVEGANLIMQKDSQGRWVKAGDEWLVNVAGYTDGWTLDTGLTLVTWNLMAAGGFHNFPRGVVKFAAATGVSDWMLQ